MNHENIAAVGMELPNGHWILYKDGRLCFDGSGTLCGGAFRTHRQKIRCIEVNGFDAIAPRQFENLPLLEAVILGKTVQQVQEEAFYGCGKLMNVTMPQDIVIGPGAFAGTLCESQNISMHPNRLADTEHGQQFVKTLNRCLRTLEKPFESDQQLMPLMEKLREGVEARDPALMFLWAEFLMWGEVVAFNEVPYQQPDALLLSLNIDLHFPGTFACMELYKGDETEGPFVWYQRAAEAGYVPAMCWLAWCARHGIGCDVNEEKAQMWLQRAEQAQPVDRLEAEELEIFPSYAAELAELAHDADIEEDEVYDSYSCQGEDAPASAFPNPDWRTLHVRSVGAYDLGCMFGKAECALRRDLSYDYDIDYDCTDFGRYWMGTEKLVWQIWCSLHCKGVTQPPLGVLHHWLNDALELHQEMQEWAQQRPDKWMELTGRLEGLLTDLTAEVLRLPE